MSSKLPLPLKVPAEIWRWIRNEAARRRMPFGNYALELIRRGILDESLERKIECVGRVTQASSPASRDLLRELITLRRLLEGQLGPQTVEFFHELHSAVEEELAQRWPEE